MKSLHVKPLKCFDAVLEGIASDKSISHRAALFSLLSDKPSHIKNYLQGEDTMCTLHIVNSLGADIQYDDGTLVITPPKTLQEPPSILDCGNSGTAIRLLMGFLASKPGFFVLHGDEYLAKRPMGRIANPLRSIGAQIDGRDGGNLAPIGIRGQKLSSFEYASPIASAQVKSAMILAALNACGVCSISEPALSRDHTERMLEGMGAKIQRDGLHVKITPLEKPLLPLELTIPADPSSAFFFALAAAITPGSKVLLKDVLLNQTRIEAYEVLRRMGTNITYIQHTNLYEPIGDILVEYGPLRCIDIDENIPWLIDEIPALSIAFANAKGKSSVRNAKELRVKESDRIATTVENLRKCGINAHEFEDGFEVIGGKLDSALVKSYGDHRIAMSFAIGGLKCGMQVDDTACIATSFPNFFQLLQKLGANIEDKTSE
jgi:3-phosphoshikimate 1-carboxyvinyltransferase